MLTFFLKHITFHLSCQKNPPPQIAMQLTGTMSLNAAAAAVPRPPGVVESSTRFIQIEESQVYHFWWPCTGVMSRASISNLSTVLFRNYRKSFSSRLNGAHAELQPLTNNRGSCWVINVLCALLCAVARGLVPGSLISTSFQEIDWYKQSDLIVIYYVIFWKAQGRRFFWRSNHRFPVQSMAGRPWATETAPGLLDHATTLKLSEWFLAEFDCTETVRELCRRVCSQLGCSVVSQPLLDLGTALTRAKCVAMGTPVGEVRVEPKDCMTPCTSHRKGIHSFVTDIRDVRQWRLIREECKVSADWIAEKLWSEATHNLPGSAYQVLYDAHLIIADIEKLLIMALELGPRYGCQASCSNFFSRHLMSFLWIWQITVKCSIHWRQVFRGHREIQVRASLFAGLATAEVLVCQACETWNSRLLKCPISFGEDKNQNCAATWLIKLAKYHIEGWIDDTSLISSLGGCGSSAGPSQSRLVWAENHAPAKA